MTGGRIAELLRMAFRKWRGGHEASVYRARTENAKEKKNQVVSCGYSTFTVGRDSGAKDDRTSCREGIMMMLI